MRSSSKPERLTEANRRQPLERITALWKADIELATAVAAQRAAFLTELLGDAERAA
jgi:hypothetical protein